MAVCHSVPGLLGSDSEALLLHEGDRTLLHRVQGICQGAPAVDRIGEIVPHVGVDLVHGRSPLEIDIHLRGRFLEQLVDALVPIERLGGVHLRRS